MMKSARMSRTGKLSDCATIVAAEELAKVTGQPCMMNIVCWPGLEQKIEELHISKCDICQRSPASPPSGT